jgi:hypothetical protein
LDKARQRKLEARQRRRDSLANFGAVSQEPKEVLDNGVIDKNLNKSVEKNNVVKDKRISVQALKERNRKMNLIGIKKPNIKGKEKKNG